MGASDALLAVSYVLTNARADALTEPSRAWRECAPSRRYVIRRSDEDSAGDVPARTGAQTEGHG